MTERPPGPRTIRLAPVSFRPFLVAFGSIVATTSQLPMSIFASFSIADGAESALLCESLFAPACCAQVACEQTSTRPHAIEIRKGRQCPRRILIPSPYRMVDTRIESSMLRRKRGNRNRAGEESLCYSLLHGCCDTYAAADR